MSFSSHAFPAAVRLQLAPWLHSRAPLRLVAFVVVICGFDAVGARGALATPWYTPLAFLAALTGIMAGYDIVARPRRDGSLRLMLHRSIPRPLLALAMVWSGAVASVAATLVALVYLVASGRAPLAADVALALLPALLGIVSFVALGQLLALLLPPEGAALAGMLVIGFGASPSHRWLPADAPAMVVSATQLLWSALPASVRLHDLVAGRSVALNATIIAAQVLVLFSAICVLLGRTALRVGRGPS